MYRKLNLSFYSEAEIALTPMTAQIPNLTSLLRNAIFMHILRMLTFTAPNESTTLLQIDVLRKLHSDLLFKHPIYLLFLTDEALDLLPFFQVKFITDERPIVSIDYLGLFAD